MKKTTDKHEVSQSFSKLDKEKENKKKENISLISQSSTTSITKNDPQNIQLDEKNTKIKSEFPKIDSFSKFSNKILPVQKLIKLKSNDQKSQNSNLPIISQNKFDESQNLTKISSKSKSKNDFIDKKITSKLNNDNSSFSKSKYIKNNESQSSINDIDKKIENNEQLNNSLVDKTNIFEESNKKNNDNEKIKVIDILNSKQEK